MGFVLVKSGKVGQAFWQFDSFEAVVGNASRVLRQLSFNHPRQLKLRQPVVLIAGCQFLCRR